MSELKIVYSDLEEAAKYARKAATECESYRDELNRKLTQQWCTVPHSPLGTGNRRVDTASYYVRQKQAKLSQKRTDYQRFAGKVENFVEHAKNADKRVAKTVNKSQKIFLDAHKNLSGSGWAAFFANIVVDCPVLGWIAEKISGAIDTAKDLANTIRYWYEVCGGKKIVDTILAIGEVALAVCGLVVAILAFPVSGFFAAIVAVAGGVSAVIGLLDGITIFAYQMKANKETDPAWSQYYGGTDSASDALRKTTFKEKWLNKWSGALATAIEITDVICSVIDIADTVKKIYSRSGLQKLFSAKSTITEKNGKPKTIYKFDFGKFKKTVTTKEGWGSIRKSLKHSWKGLVFGDSGGVDGWKKKWKRAFTSQNTNGWKRTKKIVNVFKGDLKRVHTTIKTVKSVAKTMTYGGINGKTVYSNARNVYSICGGSGKLVELGNKTVDLLGKIKKVG